MNRLESITRDYWEAGFALRHPKAPAKAVGEVLGLLVSSDRLRPEEWRLRELMHVVRFDIVEGNDKWREKRSVNGSVSMLPTRR